jgi:pre-mRNA-processing factor 6
MTDFKQFGEARDKVLGLKLDQVKDSVSGSTTVDPRGYLTDLNSLNIKSDAEISDIKKARTLLKSVITTNPKHAPGWIAAARLEEVAGKQVAARDIISKGCEECPTNEDVWLEAARLNTDENAKIILANAVRHASQSVKIWLKAKDLETDLKSQKRVLRRALEFIPNSVKLWKAVVSLEEDQEDAKILLARAVECVPLSVELWLALARLETYDNAKKVLNKARQAIPTSHEIWLAAAKLEEQQGNEPMVDTIISRGVGILMQKGSSLDRESWIKEAEQCEKEEYPLTCQAVVRATIGMGLEEEDYKSSWMEDAEHCIQRQSIVTARAIYAHALKQFPQKKSVWKRAAFLEKSHGTKESLEDLLERSVKYCPQAEILWLMWAKERWLGGDVPGARQILEAAFASNSESEQIWLAAIKLEVETGEFERARILLKSARERADTEKVWMKAAILERLMGEYDAALEILNQAIQKYPTFPKLWMIKGQIEDIHQQDVVAARETYHCGLKQCPNNTVLWLLASRLEEKAGALVKARALLEKARLLNPKSPELWCEAIRVELRGDNMAMAKALLAKSLQSCPNSGLLWSEAILMESRPQRKARSADALKKCEGDATVVATVARLFWGERKLDKARNWFNKAVKTDPDNGDLWAWLLKFEMMHGDEEKVKQVIRQCIEADPKHGEQWPVIRKQVSNFGKSCEEILKKLAAECHNDI